MNTIAARGARGRAKRIEQRRPEHDARPQRVLAERVRDREGDDEDRRGRCRPPRAPCGGEGSTSSERAEADEQHRPERGADEVVRRRPRGTAAPSAARRRSPARRARARCASRRRWASSRRRAPASDRDAPRRTGRRRRPGSPSTLASDEHRGREPRPARARPGADGERDPERERHPADHHVAHHAAEEQPRASAAPPGVGAQPPGEHGEQPDGDHRRRPRRPAACPRARRAAGTAASSRPCGGRRTTGRSRSRSRPGSRARCGRCARPCRPSPARRSGTRRPWRRRPAWGRADGPGRGAPRPRGAPVPLARSPPRPAPGGPR